jgi:aminoglycoside 6'-N-acetyltransferase
VENIRFRPLEIADLEQIGEWLRAEHVVQWWRGPTSDTAVAEKYLPRIKNAHTIAIFLILKAEVPIGMIQAVRQSGDLGDFAIDLLIGRPDMTGRGLGTSAIEAFVREYVFEQWGASSCKADPAVANMSSVKAFSKAGFISMRNFTEAGEERVLMVRRSSN